MGKNPFDFSPEPSQYPQEDMYDLEESDEIESDGDHEESFLSILRREAETKQSVTESSDSPNSDETRVSNQPLTDTQILMQTQPDPVEPITPSVVINDKTVERDVIYEEKVETTIKITKTYFYVENGKRVLVSSPTSTIHTTSSCKEICEKRKVEEIDQTQSQIGKPTRKRQRIESSGSSESDELFQTQLESQEPPWFEKWSNVSIKPSGTSCRRTNPGHPNSAYYPATVIDIESNALRVVYDDIEMKLKKVLVKKSDTLLISELGRGNTILARKKNENIYNSAVIVASYQKTNLLDMTHRDGQLECALTNGYVVEFCDQSQESENEFFIPNSDIALDAQLFTDENSQPLEHYVMTNSQSDDLVNIIGSKRTNRHQKAERRILFAQNPSENLRKHCRKTKIQLESELHSQVWTHQKSRVECLILNDEINSPLFVLGALWNLPIVKFENDRLEPVKIKFQKELSKLLTELDETLQKNETTELSKFISRAVRNKNGFRSFAKLYKSPKLAL